MKRYLLFVLTMLCTVTGAWADAPTISSDASIVTITTNGDTDLSELTSEQWSEVSMAGGSITNVTKVKVNGNLDNDGLKAITDRLNPYTTGKILDLSGATMSGFAFPTASDNSTGCLERLILPQGVSVDTYLNGANKAENLFTVYSFDGTTITAYLIKDKDQWNNGDWTSADNIISDTQGYGSSTYNVLGVDNAPAQQRRNDLRVKGKTVVEPYDGNATAAAGNVATEVGAQLTAKGATVEQVKTLSLTAGTLTDADVTYIKTLTGLTTLNLSNATVSATLIYQLLSETNINSIVLSESQKTSLQDLTGKTFTGTMLSRVGISSTELIDGMTNKNKHNYVIEGTTLFVTGQLSTDDKTTIQGILNSNSIQMFDVSKCTNNTQPAIEIMDADLPNVVTSVSLPGNEYIVYNGNKTKLEQGALIIAINSTPGTGEYASIANALSSSTPTPIYTALNNGSVKHVKVTGALSDTDLANVHEIASFAAVETINLSEATATDWLKLTGDFSKAGVFLHKDQSSLTLTNANTFYLDCDVLNANRSDAAADDFNKELQYFCQKTGKGIVQTNVSYITNDMLQLAGVTTIVRTNGEGALIRPNHEITASEQTDLKTAFNDLWYIYSPTSDNQTKAEQFVPDRVLVLKSGGLDKAVKAETAVTAEKNLYNSIYVKVISDAGVYLNNDDLSLQTDNTSEVKAVSEADHAWQFCDFSEALLNPATVGDVKAAHNYTYRIILPNNIPSDQMAGFCANPNVGSLAAVYTYFGNTLHILEVKDNAYAETALRDPRIVRPTTNAIEVVSGAYNGVVYSSFGQQILAAVNQAQATIKSLKVTVGSDVVENLLFTNTNLQTIELNVQKPSAYVNVNSSSSLQTLKINNSKLQSVTAQNLSTLAIVDMSGSTIEQASDFTDSNITTFTTTDQTWFKGQLKLINTTLTAFATNAKVNSDIFLNGSSNVASIDLHATQFSSADTKVHIHATNDEGDTNIIVGLKKEENSTIVKTITVATGTENSKRFHPYSDGTGEQLEQRIKTETFEAPRYSFSNSYMYLHEKSTTGTVDDAVVTTRYDNYCYWYCPKDWATPVDAQGDLTIGMNESRRGQLSTILTEALAAKTDKTKTINRLVITGPISSDDIAALSGVNANILDLSEAILQKKVGSDPSYTYTEDITILKGVTNNNNVKFLVLPTKTTRDNLELKFNTTSQEVESDLLSGFTGLYTAIAYDASTKTMVNYTKVEGTLAPAVVAASGSMVNQYSNTLASIGSDFIPSSLDQTNYYAFTPNGTSFDNVYLSGNLNAYDVVSNGIKLDKDGHLTWNISHQESVTPDPNRHLDGGAGEVTAYGGLNNASVKVLDMKFASFPQNSDMTVSVWNSVGSQCVKCVIPEMPTVKELPADFFRIDGTTIWAWCIPSNIETLRSRAFITADYIWTTSNANTTIDPEGTNTRLDNGIFRTEAAFDSNTKSYATTDKQNSIDPNFVYHITESNPRPYMGSYTFGSNIKLIETGFLPDATPNVGDVYVLNTEAPECHVDAFNTTSYDNHGGFDATISEEGIIKRKNYKGMAMLHYPRQTTTPNIQRYTDPTRQYSVATGLRDGKGATLYFPTHSEFIRAYVQGTYGYTWNAWNPTRSYGMMQDNITTEADASWYSEGQAAANNRFTSNTVTDVTTKKYSTFYDVTKGGNSKPEGLEDYDKVYWSDSERKNNSTGGDGYQQLYNADYRGWHQFVLTAYAANTVLDEEPYRSYIEDNEWWTICPEFDITHDESALLFGTYSGVTTNGSTTYPYICKLQYVVRNYGTKKISLCFSNDLNRERETFSSNDSKHGATDDKTGILTLNDNYTFNDNDVVMKAGVPYLIKPSFSPGAVRQFRIFRTNEDLAKYNKANTESNVVAFSNESLYYKIQASQSASGTSQREAVKAGTYTVPVFVSKAGGEGLTKEGVEMIDETETPKTFKIGDVEYNRSTEYHYTFVGTFYKSFLPHHCYFLGWDGSLNNGKGGARFYYHNGRFDTIDHEMHWANGTGVIVPTLADDLEGSPLAFKYIVKAATGKDNPAQWDLKEKFKDDSFKSSGSNNGSSGARSFDMVLDAPDVKAVDNEQTGISELETETTTGNISVYSIDGQLRGQSLRGLKKGVYVVNGKKMIVK